jgi:hypothetical protein
MLSLVEQIKVLAAVCQACISTAGGTQSRCRNSNGSIHPQLRYGKVHRVLLQANFEQQKTSDLT